MSGGIWLAPGSHGPADVELYPTGPRSTLHVRELAEVAVPADAVSRQRLVTRELAETTVSFDVLDRQRLFFWPTFLVRPHELAFLPLPTAVLREPYGADLRDDMRAELREAEESEGG